MTQLTEIKLNQDTIKLLDQKVLTLIDALATGPKTINQLLELTNISSRTTIYKSLEKLEELNLIEREEYERSTLKNVRTIKLLPNRINIAINISS